MTAVVKELTRLLDVLKAVKIMFKASPKVKTSDFLKLSKLRVYLIKPKKIWMNDADKMGELWVDYRVPVKLG